MNRRSRFCHQEQILSADPEIFVALSAIDETFSQIVHSRFSYADRDIVHGARFTDLFGTTADGVLESTLRSAAVERDTSHVLGHRVIAAGTLATSATSSPWTCA